MEPESPRTAHKRIEFDLSVPAPNGLRRGLTTGTCATAATQAALRLWLGESVPQEVKVDLPEGNYFVRVPIERVQQFTDVCTEASVIKDAGDDPDVTHGSRVRVQLKAEGTGIQFSAGSGVGTITKQGFSLPIGEPAINPVPRQMMIQTILETLEAYPQHRSQGFTVIVGIDEGEQLADKTYNPRLGIVGGLSVLGTKGIVEPKSLASWLASIELYVRIALADDAKAIVLAPGNIGQLVAEQQLGLTPERVVPMANFIGFALNAVDQELGDHHRKLEKLWLVGHPGKLAKILEDHWDTHSGVSPMAMEGILKLAKAFGVKPSLLEKCKSAKTVEAIIQQFGDTPKSSQFWQLVEQRITNKIQPRLQHVLEVQTLLFDMHRNPLGLPLTQSYE